MTVRKRIFIANLVMLIILIALVFLLSFYIIRVFTGIYMSNDIDRISIPDAGDRRVSIYELQIVFDSMLDMSVHNPYTPEEYQDYDDINSYLKATDTMAYILIDGDTVYLQGAKSADEIYKYAIKANGSVDNREGTLFYSDDSSFMYASVFERAGKTISILMFNNKLGTSGLRIDNNRYWEDANSAISKAVRSIAILGSIVIVIINLILIIAVSNSIMGPLNKLKEATKKIAEGELDFEIDYTGDDELTEVLASFDYMRGKLLETTEQQKKLEENRKEMIAGISHDLRTPLTSIKGYVSGLIDGIADSPERRTQYLTIIYNTACDLDKLVDELFLFSKLDADKMPFDFVITDLDSYLSACIDEFSFTYSKNNIVVTYTNVCKRPVYVSLDPDRFARVLINIADNSSKYKVNPVGSIHISLYEEEEGMATISIKDDGKGMDKRYADKIFDSFYRNDPARTNPVKGSGLGLSIAKQIVTRHAGTIHAETNIGEGMNIIIKLPTLDSPFQEDKGGVIGEKNIDN